eukprot:2309179-Amphidinium_carterae.1
MLLYYTTRRLQKVVSPRLHVLASDMLGSSVRLCSSLSAGSQVYKYLACIRRGRSCADAGGSLCPSEKVGLEEACRRDVAEAMPVFGRGTFRIEVPSLQSSDPTSE